MTTGIFGAFPDAARTVNGRPRKIARPLPRPRNARLHIPLFAAILLLAACNTTRWVPPGERLLVRNTITAGPKGTLTADELEPIIKQKPNKRVLGRAIYLDLYNLRDPGKVARKRALKDSLCEAENAARHLVDSSRVKECTASQRGRNGEAPVLLDSSLVQRTVEQLRNYAFKEGYFAAQVSDTVRYVRRRWPFGGWGRPYKKPKANVQYVVQAGRPWTFCTINLRVDDPSIAGYLRADSAGIFPSIHRMLRDETKTDRPGERVRVATGQGEAATFAFLAGTWYELTGLLEKNHAQLVRARYTGQTRLQFALAIALVIAVAWFAVENLKLWP